MEESAGIRLAGCHLQPAAGQEVGCRGPRGAGTYDNSVETLHLVSSRSRGRALFEKIIISPEPFGTYEAQLKQKPGSFCLALGLKRANRTFQVAIKSAF